MNAKANKAAKLNNFMKEISRNLVNYSPLKTNDLPHVSLILIFPFRGRNLWLCKDKKVETSQELA